MTRYSVYNPNREQYEVYVDFAGPVRPVQSGGPVADIQAVLPRLPASAVLRGYSDTPVGVIAQPTGTGTGVTLLQIAIFGALVWWLMKE